MKFVFLVVISTFIYLSNAFCGSQKCNKDKIPNGPLSGDIIIFDPVYDVGGTIIVKNDCEFQIKNFYSTTEMKNAKWFCTKSNKLEESIIISRYIIGSFNKKAPVTLYYDLEDIDPSCPVSLLDDCIAIILIDENYHIASAAINGKKK